MGDSQKIPSIALIAGELSGDLLGGAITRALKNRIPDVRVIGVTGPQMAQAGCESLASIDSLSVMGLAEVLPAIPRILKLRNQLFRQLLELKPDVVIGIDAPDFNLGLERKLRGRGMRTAHVVSPTIWAWRAGRAHGIARSAELMLCLLPFEPQHYSGHDIEARFIGHPLADELNPDISQQEARRRLGLPVSGQLVAILPGSRRGELNYLAEPFARAASLLHKQFPALRFITPLAKPSLEPVLSTAIRKFAPDCVWNVINGQSRDAMRAADTVLLASGTATLECLLLGRSMTVAYRTSAFTAWMMVNMGLLKAKYVSLPNLLSSDPNVTELLQQAASPENLATEIATLLTSKTAQEDQLAQFEKIRQDLRQDAAAQAAYIIEQKFLA